MSPDKTIELSAYFQTKSEIRKRITRGSLQNCHSLADRAALSADLGIDESLLCRVLDHLAAEGALKSWTGGSASNAERSTDESGAPAKPRLLRIGVVLGPNVPTAFVEDFDSDGGDVYFGSVLKGVSDVLSAHLTEVVYTHLDAEDYLSYFRQAGLDGLILVSVGSDDVHILQRMVDDNVPYVALGTSSDAPEHAAIPSVDAANRQGGFIAAKHLLDLGHSAIACINLATSHVNHTHRQLGFEDAVKATGEALRKDQRVLASGYHIDAFEQKIGVWLDRIALAGRTPTGLFACDYNMTTAAIAALSRRGLLIPRDVSLIGFDDPVSASTMKPPLTTVRQPSYEMGRRAASRLLEVLTNADARQHVRGADILDAELVVRESTCRPRTETEGASARLHRTETEGASARRVRTEINPVIGSQSGGERIISPTAIQGGRLTIIGEHTQ